MIDLFNQYLPEILAGLFPSLIAIIPVVATVIKNKVVNKNVIDLQKTVDELLDGHIDLSQLINVVKTVIEDVTENSTKEIKELYALVKEGLTKDVTELEKRFADKIKEVEHMSKNQIRELDTKLKEAKLNVRDVHEVQSEGPKEVSNL